MDEYTNVPVPTRLVPRVYGFIAEQMEVMPTAETTPSANDPAPTDKKWTAELIERQYAESPKSIKALQKHLAAHPGEDFTSEEVAPIMGLKHGWNSVAGALGAYGRRVKNRYGMNTWVFEGRWSVKEDRKWAYVMKTEYAEIVSAL